VFAPNADAIPVDELKALTAERGLKVAAVGTGGGWVIHKWHLCQPDAASRENAKNFIRSIIDAGAQLGAPAIIGSMQGRFEGAVSREQALEYLRAALNELGEHAKAAGVPLIYEPLNRYESNLLNRAALGLKPECTKRLTDILHTFVGNFGTLDKMALIIVTVTTTQKQNAIHTRGHGVLNPNHVHGAKAANRNKPNQFIHAIPMHA
jgi:sugar phosphate isomerase/epimerase